jgi:hypothetical protein
LRFFFKSHAGLIPRALSELPANWPGRFSQKGWLGQLAGNSERAGVSRNGLSLGYSERDTSTVTVHN